jgi:uncharacterized protein YndB with AHSA1/START domain
MAMADGRGRKMLEAAILIERSVDVVWEYFIQPANWEEWYGGGLKEVVPRWAPIP